VPHVFDSTETLEDGLPVEECCPQYCSTHFQISITALGRVVRQAAARQTSTCVGTCRTIDYISLSKAHQCVLGARVRIGSRGRSNSRTMGRGGVVHCRVGGEHVVHYVRARNCLTMHCRIVQYRCLQLQCILHFR
jgi:hypothetical protein